MKKIIFSLLTILTVGLSSCLKDKPNTDFSHLGTFTELVNSGKANFTSDAITSTADTSTTSFLINVDSPQVPTTASTVTLAVDNSLLSVYNTTGAAVTYTTMPSGSYKLSATTVTIPSGIRVATVTLTIYKNQLDPSLSYMLPVKIASTTAGSISGNFGVHYFHIIGNDFAGTYHYGYTRYNSATPTGTPLLSPVAGATTIITPVSPTEFEMTTGYNGNGVKYDVTFTRTVSSSGAVTYSNWNVVMDAASVTSGWVPNGISLTSGPNFLLLDPANKHFTLQYVAFNGSAYRYIIDDYYK